jgi:hypothetical protein
VSTLELGVLLLTAVTAAVGAWSIYWTRSEPSSWRGRSGRLLFVVNLLALGVTGLVAALARAQGLPPLGLIAGLLVVAMMWESPAAMAEARPGIAEVMRPDGHAS